MSANTNPRGFGIVCSSDAPLLGRTRYRSFRLEWEDKLTEYFRSEKLPAHWKRIPPTIETMQIGDDWVQRAASVALGVPSVLSASEMNFLLNPKHPDFKKIKIASRSIIGSIRAC